MANMVVRLEWDGNDLGPTWMNPDNLALLLYSPNHSTKEHLMVTVLSEDYQRKGRVMKPKNANPYSFFLQVKELEKQNARLQDALEANQRMLESAVDAKERVSISALEDLHADNEQALALAKGE
ncbi:MAG: hypothetical protein ACYSW6_11725 [Planctomycetota bacterium]|jgi:hypothetical protein